MLFKSPYTDEEFQRYYAFRWQQLRAPWQQPRGSEKDELEEVSFHVMAVTDENEIIGVGRLHFIDDETAQIRYMAVDPVYQGQGIGGQLLHHLEEYAASAGRYTILLHARENALRFYEKLGYEKREKSHLLYGEIQHFRMEKSLIPAPRADGPAA